MVLAASAVRAIKQAGRVAFAAAVAITFVGALWATFLQDNGSSVKAGGPPLLIYSEFGSASDTIYSARADDPTQRTRVVTIAHASEYGISASLSPDAKRIAYVVLPPNAAPAIDSPSEVWVMAADGHDRTRLATGADLPVTPVWSSDGTSVVFRRSDPATARFQLVAVTLDGTESTLYDSADGLLPVGFTPAGDFYFLRLSPSGSDIGVIRSDGTANSAFAHLSDDFVRDWHLSPDGTKVSYLASHTEGDQTTYNAEVLDLQSNPEEALSAFAVSDPTFNEFNPLWRPKSGGVTIGRLNAEATASPVEQVVAFGGPPIRLFAAPQQGFDVPLSWSPDADYLAVRSYEGSSVEDPGRSWVAIAGADGSRHTVSPSSDVDVIGWTGGE